MRQNDFSISIELLTTKSTLFCSLFQLSETGLAETVATLGDFYLCPCGRRHALKSAAKSGCHLNKLIPEVLWDGGLWLLHFLPERVQHCPHSDCMFLLFLKAFIVACPASLRLLDKSAILCITKRLRHCSGCDCLPSKSCEKKSVLSLIKT